MGFPRVVEHFSVGRSIMEPDPLPRRNHLLGRPSRPVPLLRYALGWTAAATLAVLVAVLAFRGIGGGDGAPSGAPRPDGVLASARAAGCSFRRVDDDAHRAPTGPAVAGRVDATPAPDGAYAQAPRSSELLAALADGRVVIRYRPTIPAPQRALLERLYDHDRGAVILTPEATGMDGVVAATAWRRVLTCDRVDRRVTQAIAEFRDQFRGRGPR
jgi:hypothetical protein